MGISEILFLTFACVPIGFALQVFLERRRAAEFRRRAAAASGSR